MALVVIFILTLHLYHKGWRAWAVVPLGLHLLAYVIFLALIPGVRELFYRSDLLAMWAAVEFTPLLLQLAMHLIKPPYAPVVTDEDIGPPAPPAAAERKEPQPRSLWDDDAK